MRPPQNPRPPRPRQLHPQPITLETVDEWERLQRRENIDERIKEAADQEQALDAKVQDLSQDHLTKILRLSPSRRFEHIDDMDLVPEHRRELLRSLQAASRSRIRTLQLRLRFGWAPMVRRVFRSTLLRTVGLTALGLGLYIQAAARHDGRIVVLNVPFEFTMTNTDGRKEIHSFAPGTVFTAVEFDEKTVMIRRWWPGSDYVTLPVPKRDVTFSLDRSASPAYDVILDVLRSVRALWEQPDPTRPRS